MNRSTLGLFALTLLPVLCPAESTPPPMIVNPEKVTWVHSPKDPAGVESVVLREDSNTGGLELLARYPAGHVFPAHWHESNERIVLLEGRLSLGGDPESFLEPGGFAFLTAREPQRLSCVSKTRCVFYVAWDGKPNSHRVSQELPARK